MKSILKILAFTALLLISKLTRESEPIATSVGDSPGIATTQNEAADIQIPGRVTGGNMAHETTIPGEQVQTLVLTPATIE